MITTHKRIRNLPPAKLRRAGILRTIQQSFLAERGFTLDDADHFGMGYSPAAWDELTKHLKARGFTEDELLKAVWPESFVEEGNLVQHVVALRKAFADRAGYIVTVPGRGYQFAAEVHEEQIGRAHV